MPSSKKTSRRQFMALTTGALAATAMVSPNRTRAAVAASLPPHAAVGSSSRDPAAWLKECDVVWNSPSKDAAGSMPMGNGEVGINFWATSKGELHFYFSRSDSFSEVNRILKVGALRLALQPNPLVSGSDFLQSLSLHDGVCTLILGTDGSRTTLRVFVDSDHPVVHITGETQIALEVTASIETWREKEHTLASGEDFSAWAMRGAPFALIESADVFPAGPPDTLVWYHRNEKSCVADTIKLQSLQSIADTIVDPLIHRTFGGYVTGAGFVGASARSIKTSEPVKTFALRIAVPCMQCKTPEIWLQEAKTQSQLAADADAALIRTTAWWHAFWQRSWVSVNGNVGIKIPGERHSLLVGIDSNGQNKFPGTLGIWSVYSRALGANKINALAAGRHDAPVPNRRTLLSQGRGGSAKVAPAQFNFSRGMTLAAWIKLKAKGSGRIFNKLTPGLDDGFLFDTYPDDTLRLVVGNTVPPLIVTQHPIPLNRWVHVAATVDAATGDICIYMDGKMVLHHTSDSASSITRGYNRQRYMQACGGRGNFPIRFNGGQFTVEPAAMGQPWNADWRTWGNCYWWQNTRHMYHPMPAQGDTDMMAALFDTYERARPVCTARAKLYHHVQGCYFPETMTPWGTYANGDYGWNRSGLPINDVTNGYIKHSWDQGLELVNLMLNYWDYSQDETFLQERLVPMAVGVLDWFDQRFARDAAGKIILNPTQCLESFWYGVINDAPNCAGLNAITDRLCALPAKLVPHERQKFFERMRAAAPAVPAQMANYQGKVVRKLSPAEKYNPAEQHNTENPELYPVWPFKLYRPGKAHYQQAVYAYKMRRFHLDVGWGYDSNCAAVLGMADEAARILQIKCANSNSRYRWPATWGPNYDWLPDQNHGGNLLETTNTMLLQADGDKILLLPAWPRHWDVTFKLHAPKNTVVECEYRQGKVIRLDITPANRRADVVVGA